ncbi:cytochrome b [Aliidiomarina sp.]|uniref:cytochrome b n=1 Tax=Aliidiomarina sp. TaxID=1872439 RepID=UPI003A4E0C75
MALVKQIKNSKQQYGWVAIFMHWLVAVVVLGMYPLGLYIVSLGYYDSGYRIYPNIHRSIGILLAMVILLRVAWKLLNPNPSMLARSKLERFAAHAGHTTLYLLLLTVVTSGYLLSTADGRSIRVFDWFSVPAIQALATRQEDFWGNIHFYAATGMMILVAVHLAAAVKHHYVNRDATLKRMLGVQENTHDTEDRNNNQANTL